MACGLRNSSTSARMPNVSEHEGLPIMYRGASNRVYRSALKSIILANIAQTQIYE
jgi:hypothetical protein